MGDATFPREGHAMMGRSLLIAVASVVFANQLSAQAPPPVQATEQRLKALEAKMDRVINLREGRQKPPLNPADFSAKHIELITQAKDTLLQRYEQVQKDYANFRRTSPYIPAGKSYAESVSQRISKLNDLLNDVRQREDEVAARSALVKKVGESEKDARALLMLLQRSGVDVDAMRRAAGGNLSATELLRSFGESLALESMVLQLKTKSLEQMIASDKKEFREMLGYQVDEERLRTTRDQTQKMLDAVVSQLEKIDVIRGLQNQPKP
jgi:hypothetical protein